MKFDKDKRRWIHWLFEAKKRFGLMILNFTVTSNHIHLLVYDGKVNIIPKSIQLIAGRRQENIIKEKIERAHSGKIDIMQLRLKPVSIYYGVWHILI